jgi:serine/threonine protein kinase
MRITLMVIAGPHKGQEFSFGGHDTFLVGRSKHAHFRLPTKDKFFSRVHFMVEVNPPQCRLIDLGSHNGTYINGVKLLYADLHDGDQIRAGHTILKLAVHPDGEPQVAGALSGPKTISFHSDESVRAEPPAFLEIPGYKLAGELGRGGMGVVYKATRLADKTPVAIKTIGPQGASSSAQLERFLTEARGLRDLDHPHIVRFHDQGITGGFVYFVMDYFHGTDAGKILAQDGPFAIERAVRLIGQLLQALEYAHAKNVIHRDIKPANILITEIDGRELAKWANFGLARIYQASQLSGLTMTMNIGDSAGFMPPEQITNYQEAAPHTDQYATAATLYTLLTGQHVFNFPSEIHRQFSLILKAQPVPIQKRRPEIRQELAAVIHKGLARNPSQRFANVGEFRNALLATLV